MTKSAVLYARISVATEESVSVARQLVLGRKYAEARGWEVVGEFVDEGVSATFYKPEKRAGWQALLASELWFDAVIVWKVDRLSRRVIDFLRADEVLQARGAALVCVEQTIDMTSGEGRAFAQMLAVFSELESAAISARLVSAKSHLIQAGRIAGGPPLYGWMAIPNPDGPGKVLAKDPERIDWTEAMARRALAGDTVTDIRRWLTDAPAPQPRVPAEHLKAKEWAYCVVHRILKNPLLAGMILYNPDNGMTNTRDVLRDARGDPIIRADLAVISVTERQDLLSILDERTRQYHQWRIPRGNIPPILRGLAHCGLCDRQEPMRPCVKNGRHALYCPALRAVHLDPATGRLPRGATPLRARTPPAVPTRGPGPRRPGRDRATGIDRARPQADRVGDDRSLCRHRVAGDEDGPPEGEAEQDPARDQEPTLRRADRHRPDHRGRLAALRDR